MKIMLFLLFITLVFNLAQGRPSPDQSPIAVEFAITEVSIETYYTSAGWTPVVLFSKYLEIHLIMSPNGQVYELDSIYPGSGQALFTIDVIANQVYFESFCYPMTVVTESAVRTRLRLPKHAPPFRLILRGRTILKGSIAIGGHEIKINSVTGRMVHWEEGTYELRLSGTTVYTPVPLFYHQAIGIFKPIHEFDLNTRQKQKPLTDPKTGLPEGTK